MKNKLLKKISGHFLIDENIEDILNEYITDVETFAKIICEIAKDYHALDRVQQQNLTGCISAFLCSIGTSIETHTRALSEKQFGDKYFATDWQERMQCCKILSKMAHNIVLSAEQSENKDFAYMILLKNQHYVAGRYHLFEDRLYCNIGQINTPSGLPAYHYENRIKCQEKIKEKMGKIKEVFQDSDAMMVADMVLNDDELSSLMCQVEQSENYLKNILEHYAKMEEEAMVAETNRKIYMDGKALRGDDLVMR